MPAVTQIPGSVDPVVSADGTIRYRARLTIRGRRESLGTYATEAEAWGVIRGVIAELTEEERSGVTLATWAGRWQERRETDRLHRATVTTASLIRARILTAPFARFPLRKITRQHIVAWLRAQLRSAPNPGHRQRTTPERRTSRSTVVNALNVLRCMLRDAADEGHLDANPAEGVRVPRVPTTEEGWTYLESDEIAALLALPVDTRGKARALRGHILEAQHSAVTCAIYTGLRQGELWGLRWADVHLDGDRPRLVVRHSYGGPTKAGRVREVPLLEPAREALVRRKRHVPGVGRALVWPASDRGCHRPGYDAGWRRVRELAGVTRSVRWHDLRHTCASHLVMGSLVPELGPLPLEAVKAWLGHTTVKVTERYAHLAPGALHDVVRRGRERSGER